MPKVIVPEAPRVIRAETAAQTQQNRKIPSNTFIIPFIPDYLPMLEAWRTWLENFPGDPTCFIKTFLLHARDIAHEQKFPPSKQVCCL